MTKKTLIFIILAILLIGGVMFKLTPPKPHSSIGIVQIETKDTVIPDKQPFKIDTYYTEEATTELSEDKQHTYNASPISGIDDNYTGIISIDLSQYKDVKVDDLIDLDTPYGDITAKVNDLYLDHGQLVLNFSNDDNAEGLIIYDYESNTSFVKLSSENIILESHLDSNGVGEFTNVMEYYKQGILPSVDKPIHVNELTR